MRLWSQELIQKLPRQQLLGQHRECCALRGNGWGKNHSVVNYVFEHPYSDLFAYHMLVVKEMWNRGYSVNEDWLCSQYRGKVIGYDSSDFTVAHDHNHDLIYAEHNEEYLKECVENLKNKDIYVMN